jgi:hypothetical protein
MTTKKKDWQDVPYVNERKGVPTKEFGGLSQYHAGQIVTPCVEFRKCGQTYYADYYWVDASIGRNEEGHQYGHGAVKGDFWGVVHGLRAAGIRLD